MKIRAGFVSNSSTSSFCMYGVCFESSNELLKKMDVSEYDLKTEDYTYPDDIMWDLSKKMGEKGWSYQNPYGYSCYFGRELGCMKDEETWGQWKKDIEETIKKLFPGQDLDFGIYEEAWRDG